jgi:hypothetical protein
MTAIVRQDQRGRWQVQYSDSTYVGTYEALDQADAHYFATSPERQAADRAFAVAKFMERTGRGATRSHCDLIADQGTARIGR